MSPFALCFVEPRGSLRSPGLFFVCLLGTLPVAAGLLGTPLGPARAAAPCEPQCLDRVCGDDGCGGTCGQCPEGRVCSPVGTCDLEGCTDQCLEGSAGCIEEVAWVCERMEDDCTAKVETDCAALNAFCESGTCLGGAAGYPVDDEEDEGWKLDAFQSDAGSGGTEPAPASSDEGCQGGSTWPALPWLGAAILWLNSRRRAAPEP